MKISSDLLKSLKELSFEAANAIMKVYSQEFISEEKKDGSIEKTYINQIQEVIDLVNKYLESKVPLFEIELIIKQYI